MTDERNGNEVAKARQRAPMYLVRVPDCGAPSCHPVDPLEVRWLETRGGIHIRNTLREPMAWRWNSHISGSGVSAVGRSPDEAMLRIARFEEGAHVHA